MSLECHLVWDLSPFQEVRFATYTAALLRIKLEQHRNKKSLLSFKNYYLQ
jgi:hypothetical protein